MADASEGTLDGVDGISRLLSAGWVKLPFDKMVICITPKGYTGGNAIDDGTGINVKQNWP